MSEFARLREMLRPHGVKAAGCHNCRFLRDCGGIEPELGLLDCFAVTNCGKAHCSDGTCDHVCPFNKSFLRQCNEIRGLRFDNLAPLQQRRVRLPLYVPMIHHGSNRAHPLEYPVVALDPYRLFHWNGDRYETVISTARELRDRFRLHPSTDILLRGVSTDPPLEKYWKCHTKFRTAEQLATLDILLATGPNFSHFLDVPRTDNLFNRKRQLLCVEQFAAAGLNAVPHLSGRQPGDLQFWRDYLLRNPGVTYISQEFQTGNKNRKEGLVAVERIAWLQDQIGRSLHPIIIGGTQFVSESAARFDHFTIIDSRPFMNAVNRSKCQIQNGRISWQASPIFGALGIDDHLDHNIRVYSSWLKAKAAPAQVGRRNAKTYAI